MSAAPVDVSDPPAAEPGAGEAAEKLATEPAPVKASTISIDGREVATADVAPFFDATCDLRCDAGALTRWVPPPKDMKQLRGRLLQITTLCPCAVRGYRKANPAPVDLVAGAAALRAAANPAPAGPGPRAAQVARIREELARRQDDLAAVRAQIAVASDPASAARHAPVERALARKVDKCKRRIAAILRHHPEAAGG